MADYSALQKYFDSRDMPGSPTGPSMPDVAKFILLNATQKPSTGLSSNKNSPSVLSRLFDILSRPNYAVANLAKDTLAHNDVNPIKSIISGLAGTQKTTFDKVLEQAGMPSNNDRHALGLALDIGLDPTTYFNGAGLVSKGLDLIKGAKGVEEVSKELPAAEKALRAGEPAIPENFNMPKTSGEIPEALKPQTEIPQLPEPLKAPDVIKANQPQMALDFRVPDIQAQLAGEIGKTKSLIPNKIQAPLKVTKEVPVDPIKELKGQLSIPGMPVKKMREAGKLMQVKKAEDIIDGLKQGDITEALKLVPPPPPVLTPIHISQAESILKDFKPGKADATINPAQQVNLFNKAGKDLGTLSVMENQLENAGKVFRIGTGENVKLSEVIGDLNLRGVPITDELLHEFSTKIQPGSELAGAIERARARGSIKDSVKIKDVTDIVGDSKAITKSTIPMSDYAEHKFDSFLKDFAEKTAKVQGTSAAGIMAQRKLVNMTLDAGKSKAQIAVQHMSKELDDVIATGKANGRVTHVTTLALEKDFGKLPAFAVNDNKALEFLMGRVATWWGQSDLRPLSLIAVSSMRATAQARGAVLANLFRPFDKPQRLEAFRFAQGLTQPNTDATRLLGLDIMRTMDDLVGQAAGKSVLLRSGVNLDRLNEWMRRYGTGFEFTKGQMKSPITGAIQDFSKGSDWVNSWRMADVKEDPAVWIFKTMEALEQATREKSLFDEIGERFGSQIAGKEYRTKITGHPYLEPYHFPSDIAKQLPRVIKDWTPGTANNNEMLKLYDRVLSMWKSSATIYRPGFHVRNLIGDTYMGMLDGVVSVKPYKYALQVQRSMGAYESMSDVDKLVEMGLVKRGVETPAAGKVLFRNKSGVGFTAEQIAAVAHQKGLLEHYKTIEDIIDTGAQGGVSLTRPFAGKVQKFAGTVAEMQSHNARLAHFIDKVMKSRGSDLQTIFEEAARRSRKYHPSGIDLTEFERTVLRRIIPFYSWIRKSTPVLLEGIVMKPGITVLPAKIGQTLQEVGGIEGTDRGNPFPVDQMFPSWLRNEGIGPIGTPDSFLGKLSNQQPGGYVQGGVGLNPLASLLAQFQDPSKTIGSSLTPALQIPIELITGKKIFSGEPITGPDAKPGALGEYIGGQVPAFSALQGVTGFGLAGQTNKSIKSDGGAQKEALVNWLTGLGIKGTGAYKKQARFEVTAPLKTQQKASKEDFLAQLRQQLAGG
jgi:hypothetical protein